MRPYLTRRDRKFAEEIFDRYSAKEGSEHIASQVALAYLSACLRVFRPRTVIECGAGIGTITDALLSHDCGVERVIAIENVEFCLDALTKNLGHHDRSRLAVITNASDIPIVPADMIIADGGYGCHEAFRSARHGSVIFIEGNRRVLRDGCVSFLAGHGLAVSFEEFGATHKFKWKLRWRRFKWKFGRRKFEWKFGRRKFKWKFLGRKFKGKLLRRKLKDFRQLRRRKFKDFRRLRLIPTLKGEYRSVRKGCWIGTAAAMTA